jgi:hypothetical protein
MPVTFRKQNLIVLSFGLTFSLQSPCGNFPSAVSSEVSGLKLRAMALCAKIAGGSAEVPALGPDLSGITYFEERKKYLGELKIAKGDGFIAEYYPRTDEYMIYVLSKTTNKDSLVAKYNGRSGSYQVENQFGSSQGLMTIRHAQNTAGFAMLKSGMELIEKKFGIPFPLARRDYPEVKPAVAHIQQGLPVSYTEIKDGETVLFQDKNGNLVLTLWGGIEIDKEFRRGQVFTQGHHRLGGHGLEITPDFLVGEVRVLGGSIGSRVSLFMNDLVLSAHNFFGEHFQPGKIWRVSEEDFTAIAKFAPKFEDTYRNSMDSISDYLILNALIGIQYEKWGSHEIEKDIQRGYAHRKEADARYNKENFKGYERALDHLIQRFGSAKFAEGVKSFFQMNLQGLHTRVQEQGSPYQPHSDFVSRYGYLFQTVQETIRSAYPVPVNPMEHVQGGYANLVTLFGDAEFWTHMRDHYPDLFQEFASFYLTLEKPTRISHNWYGTWDVDPVGVLKHFFSEAYAIILEKRPDFTTTLSMDATIVSATKKPQR